MIEPVSQSKIYVALHVTSELVVLRSQSSQVKISMVTKKCSYWCLIGMHDKRKSYIWM